MVISLKIIIKYAGLIAAIGFAIYLFFVAHKGDYTTWLIGNLVVQALFTGAAWLYLKDTRFNSKYLPFVLAGISFIFPLIGALTRNNPEKELQKQVAYKDPSMMLGATATAMNTVAANP